MARTKQIPSKRDKRKEKKGGVGKSKSKKKRRFHPGTVALREIKKQQKSTKTLIPKKHFQRCVREIAYELGGNKGPMEGGYRFQCAAIASLQEAAESYLITLFRDSYAITVIIGERKTLYSKDMKMARRIRGE